MLNGVFTILIYLSYNLKSDIEPAIKTKVYPCCKFGPSGLDLTAQFPPTISSRWTNWLLDQITEEEMEEEEQLCQPGTPGHFWTFLKSRML